MTEREQLHLLFAALCLVAGYCIGRLRTLYKDDT